VINDDAITYVRERAQPDPVIARLLEHWGRRFANRSDWSVHLDRLGISALKVNPDPLLIATEGALWGGVKAHGFFPDTVIVSDDAGQFDIAQRSMLGAYRTDHHRACPRFERIFTLQADFVTLDRLLIWLHKKSELLCSTAPTHSTPTGRKMTFAVGWNHIAPLHLKFHGHQVHSAVQFCPR
jgi:hypothetical protein